MWDKFKKRVREEYCDHCWHTDKKYKVKSQDRCKEKANEYVYKSKEFCGIRVVDCVIKKHCCLCGYVTAVRDVYGAWKNIDQEKYMAMEEYE